MDLEEKRLRREAKKNHAKEARNRVESRGANSTSILRFIIVGIVILIHLAIVIVVAYFLQELGGSIITIDANETSDFVIFLYLLLQALSLVLYVGLRIAAVFVTLGLFGRVWNSAFKLPWIIFISVSPVVGMLIYIMLGRRGTVGGRTKRRYQKIWEKLFPLYEQDPELLEQYREKDPELYHQLYYLHHQARYSAYKNTDVTYYSEGKDGLEAQIEELKKAEKFILFEYHAIENQEAFERIKKVLFQKAAEGVEVRVFYDDMGSIGFINHKFRREMLIHGVKCRVFNPLKPLMIFFMNNRDHRKITVIDGKVGFTGGYNMADEYFDITHPYGEWKDTGIKLEGEAVNSLTLIFLENWNGIRDTDSEEDIKKYLVDHSDFKAKEKDGVIIPYADGPVDNYHYAETTYMNILRDSEHYVYITTPYLLITDEMEREIIDAAQRGIDVRIITPGIPDKGLVYKMTRSYYMNLAKAGVKIYEYKYGFVHSKMIIADDHLAVVGTINFDYRSLYHHFENACLFSGYKCLEDIRKDFETMFPKCRYVSQRHAEKKRLSLIETILRLVAPLM
ncbi:MAG: cardiolipin synthase [Bacilli bacterium]|nr:cardiolipin synthase [Bacilli bacterium]